jgi:hypothetical protein|nr:MAG TPA: hypothetical protein [Caudoviricetes sp.]DAY43308.1 MAG TPA: hypothetical protein [Caudoviricetes sp.]
MGLYLKGEYDLIRVNADNISKNNTEILKFIERIINVCTRNMTEDSTDVLTDILVNAGSIVTLNSRNMSFTYDIKDRIDNVIKDGEEGEDE